MIITALCWISIAAYAQKVTYGLEQDVDNPLRITVVAYPDFNSDNVTISTAVITVMLPEGMETTANIVPAPGTGSFENITGVWSAQRITSDLYSSVGFSGADLEGNDIYQVVLQNAPEVDNVMDEMPIELFTFELLGDCSEGTIHLLNNYSAIQQSIINNLQANFNNQMSLSVDDAPSRDLYEGNNPFTSELDCPLSSPVSSTIELDATNRIQIQPNPTTDYLDVYLYSGGFSEVMLEIYDVNNIIHYRKEYQLTSGKNKIQLESVRNLVPGTYFLKISDRDNIYQEKFIKVIY